VASSGRCRPLQSTVESTFARYIPVFECIQCGELRSRGECTTSGSCSRLFPFQPVAILAATTAVHVDIVVHIKQLKWHGPSRYAIGFSIAFIIVITQSSAFKSTAIHDITYATR
jgi:hypothetical protein